MINKMLHYIVWWLLKYRAFTFLSCIPIQNCFSSPFYLVWAYAMLSMESLDRILFEFSCMRCFAMFSIYVIPLHFTILTVLLIAVSPEIIWVVVWITINLAKIIMQIKVNWLEYSFHTFDVLSIPHSILFSTSWILICLFLAGSSHKPKTGLIVGIVIGLVVILFLGGLLFFWWKGRHKGYRREIFVDVAGLSFLLDCNFTVWGLS